MHPFVHENLKRYFFYNYFFYNDMEVLVRIESNRDYNSLHYATIVDPTHPTNRIPDPPTPPPRIIGNFNAL